MEVRLHDSVDEFRALAEPLYRRDPIAHTIELTLLGGDNFSDDALLLTVSRDGELVGAAMQTPPYPLVCNGIPADALDSVAACLVDRRPELPGVRGVRATALRFAQAWQGLTGQTTTVDTEERLYRLGTLHPPADVRGSHRLAIAEDQDLLVDWVGRFFAESFSRVPNHGGAEFVAAADCKGDRFTLWTVDDVPVSMAMLRAPAAGVSRIGPVFTPTGCRGNGYGSAVTAAATQLAHRSGTADVVLFADLANQVSNAIYQRIGFEAVSDSVRIEFSR
ncbi:GNAT family N-acetyltransferase [Mycobacterium sp. 2YAF39]|uniref:GNAT family N-acetyltransferase n=1 Tax=Mycobacterium sp. 2YAF39 TaxID=3233033 RepID=UPI003F9A69A2